MPIRATIITAAALYSPFAKLAALKEQLKK